MMPTDETEQTSEAVLPNIGLPADVALVDYETSSNVKKVISSMGRTEDVKFSPDYRWLAIASITLNRINLFAVDAVHDGSSRVFDIHSSLVIESSSFIQPHGIDFIDNTHMVIANRQGKLHVFQLPAQMKHVGSMFHMFFQREAVNSSRDIHGRQGEAQKAFYLHCLNAGVLVPGTQRAFLSAAHDDAVVDELIKVFTASFDAVKAEGLFSSAQ
jgi:hypothetical protein